ncbi:hypothetical protein NDU88_004935 [Pleurodeles waltl]|uniref:Uncharacterized protein n=1 Tax=Pleurodeles waltl TaxID=8319 RepID=A0AAV7PIZ9_PLEWA|nr:hypothetical protein NDU88_004935 [Pleurodeles waltl]
MAVKGTKPPKKRLSKQANLASACGPNPLDEIDLLFEEVEAILNTHSTGSTPAKKDSFRNRKTPEIFIKKRRRQPPDIILEDVGREELHIPRNTVRSPSLVIPRSAPSSPPHQKGSFFEAAMPPPLPLSPAVRVVPNIVCTNRFNPLSEEGDLPMGMLQSVPGVAIYDNILTNPQSDSKGLESLDNGINMALILQRVDEVRSLVLALTGFMKEKVIHQCSCKCQWVGAEIRGDEILAMAKPNTSNDTPLRGPLLLYIIDSPEEEYGGDIIQMKHVLAWL